MQGRGKDREQTCSYFKCPKKAGWARPNNADLIIICCKGAPTPPSGQQSEVLALPPLIRGSSRGPELLLCC